MSLDALPDELILALLHHVPPEDIYRSVRLLSHRLYDIGGSGLLWKHHCLTSFQFWNPSHKIQLKASAPLAETDWQSLFVQRWQTNKVAKSLLDGIIQDPQWRVNNVEQICRLGVDIKAMLLEQMLVDESHEDHLARRYFSKLVRNSLDKSIAIQLWHEVGTGSESNSQPSRRFEECLVAFDMFLLHKGPNDLSTVSCCLDGVADAFLKNFPSFHTLSTRNKALTLNLWLRARNWTGLENDRNYRVFRNALLGEAVLSEKHESLPLISCVIFCCVARRLSLEAICCGVPGHVHVAVAAPTGHDPDGKPIPQSACSRRFGAVYLDPYGKDDEVPLSILEALYEYYGQSDDEDYLPRGLTPAQILLRIANNMRVSRPDHRRMPASHRRDYETSISARGAEVDDWFSCKYGALWAVILSQPLHEVRMELFMECLDSLSSNSPADAWLVSEYLRPLINTFPAALHRHQRAGLDLKLQRIEEIQSQPSATSQENRRLVMPTRIIGQIFRHQRYNWFGLVCSTKRDGESIETAGRVPFPGGTHVHMNKPKRDEYDRDYYFCLREDGCELHLVSKANMIFTREVHLITAETFPEAGRFFKRYLHEECRFAPLDIQAW